MCRVRITWWTRSTSKVKQQAGLLKFTRFHNQFPLYYGLVKIKTRWQNRHVDNCGLYENDKCCKVCKFGKDSSKVCENCLFMISNFYKKNNLGENGEFGNKQFIKGFAKIKTRWQKKDVLNCGFLRKCNFFEINEFWEKYIKGLTKFKWDKRGHLVQIAITRKWQI